jgi:hypothetical protein
MQREGGKEGRKRGTNNFLFFLSRVLTEHQKEAYGLRNIAFSKS